MSLCNKLTYGYILSFTASSAPACWSYITNIINSHATLQKHKTKSHIRLVHLDNIGDCVTFKLAYQQLGVMNFVKKELGRSVMFTAANLSS